MFYITIWLNPNLPHLWVLDGKTLWPVVGSFRFLALFAALEGVADSAQPDDKGASERMR